MKVKVKLFALLEDYLPVGARNNEVEMEVVAGTTAAAIVKRLNLPAELCHLVLLNGNYLEPGERGSRPLAADDVLAIWPPIAGG
ncbi:MAG: MoaD/ThiS family protein [Rhodospirillales bacterium]|nr:MoaD/ThiS family protein [Rhodospirillales bacterium]